MEVRNIIEGVNGTGSQASGGSSEWRSILRRVAAWAGLLACFSASSALAFVPLGALRIGVWHLFGHPPEQLTDQPGLDLVIGLIGLVVACPPTVLGIAFLRRWAKVRWGWLALVAALAVVGPVVANHLTNGWVHHYWVEAFGWLLGR